MRFAAAVALALVAAACSAPSVTRVPSVTRAPSTVAGSSISPVDTALRPIGATEVARVVRVVDGDTLVIDRGFGNERLRYIGMDTPESVKPGSPVEFMAREASAANAALVDGREVVLETDVSDTDRFGRLLRYVWLREGDGWVLVNLELVRRGFAQAASFPPDVRWQDEFRQAQRDAREAGLGLWGRATPAP
jgi:micrococcal nuclease